MTEQAGSHDHDHAPANFDRAFGIGIALNIAFVAVEAFYGWKIDSLALLADSRPCRCRSPRRALRWRLQGHP